MGTNFGDANLDGQFNSGDLVLVFQAGQFEDGVAGNSTREQGDWDGDREFGTADLITAFQGGAYVAAASPAQMTIESRRAEARHLHRQHLSGSDLTALSATAAFTRHGLMDSHRPANLHGDAKLPTRPGRLDAPAAVLDLQAAAAFTSLFSSANKETEPDIAITNSSDRVTKAGSDEDLLDVLTGSLTERIESEQLRRKAVDAVLRMSRHSKAFP